MENQTVTIPFLYFKELIEKSTQRDLLYNKAISNKWFSSDDVRTMLGILEKANEEE